MDNTKTAFGHDSATGNLVPEGKMAGTRVIFLIIAVLVLLFIIWYNVKGKSRSTPSRPGESSPPAAVRVGYRQPREGLIYITTNEFPTASRRGEFHGVVCHDTNMWIELHIDTANIYWQVRLDGDTNRVRRMHPKGWTPTNSVVTVAEPFEVAEVRVLPMPGYPLTEGIVSYTITPKN